MTRGAVSGIVEFIEARLAGWEGYARRFTTVDDSTAASEFAYLAARHILREVEAKRAILAELSRLRVSITALGIASWADAYDWAVLRALASIWSDHKDYDPAWGQQ